MSDRKKVVSAASDLVAYAIGRIFAMIAGMFSAAWVIMLMMGTLLGNEGLWTPAYWECFGGVYLMGAITGVVARNWFSVAAMEDRKRAEFQQKIARAKEATKRKPII